MTTLTLSTSKAIREHWRAIGKPWLAEGTYDVRPSPGGTLAVVKQSKSSVSDWYVANLHGMPFPRAWDQPGVTRAKELARRIEGLRMADGKPFDWNAAEKPPGVWDARTSNGKPLRLAIQEIAEALNAEY